MSVQISLPAWCFAILVSTCMCAAAFADGGPLWEKIDRDELATTWRQLSNERLMFPMDMSDVAMKIGPERQLFLDNCLIAVASNVTREVHHPTRSEHNPMLEDQTVWWLQHVMMFDESPRFRMWYNPNAGFHPWKEGERIRFVTAYAVSDDGVNWTRPELGLHKTPFGYGNVVLPYGMMQGIFYEPWEEDPDKRFKALVCIEVRKFEDGQYGETTLGEGYFLHTSPDGIRWKGDLSHQVIPSLGGTSFPIRGLGDTSRFWWDSIRRKYMGDVKWVLSGTRRSRGIMESDDLVHWTRPRPTFYGLEPNIQIYGHTAATYQGIYVGFRWRTPTDYFWDKVHAIELALDTSRDGALWTRVGTGQLFMERKNTDRRNYDDPRPWDADQMAARSMLVVGDEIWLYYNGAGSVGLAKLRLDGFASLNGGDQTGTVVTRPLTFEGKTLHVNAEVAEGGELLVGFRTRDERDAVEGFAVDDCVPLTGDAIDMPVAWSGGADVSSLAGSFSRIEFQLRNAKGYSFWIE